MSSRHMDTFAPASRHGRRRWSDWAGSLFYGALAVQLLWRSQPFSLLLLPTFLHEALIAVAFVTRGPVRARGGSVVARGAAYVGSLGLLAFLALGRAWAPSWLTPAESGTSATTGLVLWTVGSVFGVWAVWHLRTAFSLEPAARHLVTSGPYRLARHPVYTGYLLQYGGMWLMYPTLAFAIALLAWIAVMRIRVHYEEEVLAGAFPEYTDYRRRVGRFFPRLTVMRRVAVSGGVS